MDLSRNTKRFLLLLSCFTVSLVLLISHVDVIALAVSGIFSALVPFIVGACVAFILSVPMHLFSKLLGKSIKGKTLVKEKSRKGLSLLLSILFVFLLIVLFSVIVFPQLVSTISSLAGSIIRFVPTAQVWITQVMNLLERYPQVHDAVAPLIPDLNRVASTMISLVQQYAGTAVTALVTNASALFGSVTDVIVIFVFAIYVLLQTDDLSRQSKKLLYAFLPRAFCDKTLAVARLVHKTFFSYVTIQCTEAVILGGLCFVGMFLLRFPYALVVSVIMTFCALIPIYGAIFSLAIGAFLVLIESPVHAIGFVVFILILQQIETNLIYPRVVSTSINLPSMWVLLAVTVGGGIFGIVGMLTAVPITSIAYTLLANLTRQRLQERGISQDSPMLQPLDHREK